MIDAARIIKANAHRNTKAPAICNAGGYISYGEVYAALARISNLLLERNIPEGSKVAINIGENDLFLITTLACIHNGLVPFVTGDIACVVADGSLDFVIGSGTPLDPTIAPDIMIDESVLSGRLGNSELADFPERPDGQLVAIGATTGTTGDRKLLADTAGHLRETQMQMRESPWFHDRTMVTLGPLGYFSVRAATWVLMNQGTLIRSAEDALVNLKLITSYRIKNLLITPNTLKTLLDYMEENNIQLPSLQMIRLTGSLFKQDLIEQAWRLTGADISVGYGTSEYGRISSGILPKCRDLLGYVGALNDQVKFAPENYSASDFTQLIIDDTDMRAKPYYSQGKILPQTTVYTLPDLGMIRDGILYLSGRADEVFNWGGNKISFARIEDELNRHPGIIDTGVVLGGLRDEYRPLLIGVRTRGDIDLAFVKTQTLKRLNLNQAEPAVSLKSLPQIPRNETGKIDRSALLTLFTAT